MLSVQVCPAGSMVGAKETTKYQAICSIYIEIRTDQIFTLLEVCVYCALVYAEKVSIVVSALGKSRVVALGKGDINPRGEATRLPWVAARVW